MAHVGVHMLWFVLDVLMQFRERIWRVSCFRWFSPNLCVQPLFSPRVREKMHLIDDSSNAFYNIRFSFVIACFNSIIIIEKLAA